jgi:hypothetical protein
MPHEQVHLTSDHLNRIAHCRPERAIEELIWNGLDAGGPSVDVAFELNELGSIHALEVRDSGSGIAFADLSRAFGHVGKSLKIDRKTNLEGRAFHGSEGFGRYRAVSICDRALWTTTYRDEHGFWTYSITMNQATQDGFDYSEPVPATHRITGTTVRLENIRRGHQALNTEHAIDYITERLALYLSKYPVAVRYNGEPIDPRGRIASTAAYALTDRDASVVIIDWNMDIREKRLLICDSKGFPWHEMPLGVAPRGLSLTAFLHCPEAREWDSTGRFALELDSEIARLVELARETVHGHIVRRLAEQASDLVAAWKDEQVYPYSEDEPQNPIQKAERQVFDIVASQVHLYQRGFRESPKTMKKFTLQLVRQALESNPSSLRRILEEILNLPKEEQDDFAELFNHMTLGGIIAAAKEVDERLLTLAGFETMLFDPDWRARLRERTQLHRWLVHHVWIFGDEYTLDTDDEPLRQVLERHLHILGRSELAEEKDVLTIDEREGIPDLMMSRKFERDHGRVEHLVLELKRPKDNLSDEDVVQLEKYAFSVANDERFDKAKVEWTFVLLGNELGGYARNRAQQGSGLPYGCIHRAGNLSIWIKRWSSVIHEAKVRYDFFRKHLEIEASSDDGMALIMKRHKALLTGKGLTKKQERELRATGIAG